MSRIDLARGKPAPGQLSSRRCQGVTRLQQKRPGRGASNDRHSLKQGFGVVTRRPAPVAAVAPVL